jgi:hypothetical protein
VIDDRSVTMTAQRAGCTDNRRTLFRKKCCMAENRFVLLTGLPKNWQQFHLIEPNISVISDV